MCPLQRGAGGVPDASDPVTDHKHRWKRVGSVTGFGAWYEARQAQRQPTIDLLRCRCGVWRQVTTWPDGTAQEEVTA